MYVFYLHTYKILLNKCNNIRIHEGIINKYRIVGTLMLINNV